MHRAMHRVADNFIIKDLVMKKMINGDQKAQNKLCEGKILFQYTTFNLQRMA